MKAATDPRASRAPANTPSKPAASALLSAVSVLVAVFTVATTLYGVWNFYSPIPWWDEWDGYLGFYKAVMDGAGFRAWWTPHMEHRIITSRLLFFLDLHFFHGNHILLFVAQLSMFAGLVVFIGLAARRAGTDVVSAIALSAAFLFSWVQSEILKWGFETQVIGAYFFTMWALFEFTRPASGEVRRFAAGFLLAACAEFSMGNGIAAPFALVVVAIFARQSVRSVVACLLVSIALASIYAIGYVKPDVPAPVVHGSAIANQLQFVLAFLGNPLAILGFSSKVCIAAGAVTLCVGGVLAVWLYVSRRSTPYRAFLVGLMAFSVASALAAASGRGAAGPLAALASRYTTGSLVLWTAIILLLADLLNERKVPAVGAGLAIALVLATGQTKAWESSYGMYYWKLGLLGPKIGLENVKYSAMLFPAEPDFMHDRFLSYTQYSARNRVGVYGREWLRDAGEVQFDAGRMDAIHCQGHIDSVSKDAGAYTVSGWIISPRQKRDVLVVLVQNGKTVGYGISGAYRPDVESAVAGAPRDTGWVGFSETADGLSAYGFVNGRFCKVSG